MIKIKCAHNVTRFKVN